MKKGFSTVALAAVLVGASLLLGGCKQPAGTEATSPAELRGGETGVTLDPSNFTGETAQAYRIAKEIPEVLDSMHCYCECKKHFGHKSLLSCYLDEHAKNCDVCLDETFMAYELHKQGKDILTIRKAVDQRFSNLRH